MQINFITPTRLSPLDITTMGDSSKRNDPSKIGQFDSGLKYAIALLLRYNVDITIDVFGGYEERNDWNESFTEKYNFYTKLEVCESTRKEKELIHIDVETEYHGGSPMNQYDLREPSTPEKTTIKTGFALNLGFNWELWMAFRELYSNMLDEGGRITEGSYEGIDEGTIITLVFDESSDFGIVYKNKNKFIFNSSFPPIENRHGIEIYTNDYSDNALRIFKNGILVHEDIDKYSKFTYNLNFGDLDERRVLLDIGEIKNNITRVISSTESTELLNILLTPNFEAIDNDFLKDSYAHTYNASSIANDIAHKIQSEFGEVKSYSWFIDNIKKRKDCQLVGRKISTIEDSLWSYSRSVTVDSKVTNKNTWKSKIESLYNIEIDVEIKTAVLGGSRVVADKFNNCLIISPDFDIDKDFSDFIIQFLDLKKEGNKNIVQVLGEYIKQIIKK